MTYSYERHDSFIREIELIHMRDMTHPYETHDFDHRACVAVCVAVCCSVVVCVPVTFTATRRAYDMRRRTCVVKCVAVCGNVSLCVAVGNGSSKGA